MPKVRVTMKTTATKAQASHRLPDSTPARSRDCGASQDHITAFQEPGPNAPQAIFALEDAQQQRGDARFHEDGYDRSGGRDASV